MAKHDIKGDKLQINKILSREQVRIVLENILSYAEEFPLEDMDLIYKRYLDERLAEVDGTVLFVGDDYANLAALQNAIPAADLLPGSYAYVGSGSTFAPYFWDSGSQVWRTPEGGGGGGGQLTPDQLDAAKGSLGSPSDVNRYVTELGLEFVLEDYVTQEYLEQVFNNFNFPTGARLVEVDFVLDNNTSGTINIARWYNDSNVFRELLAVPKVFQGLSPYRDCSAGIWVSVCQTAPSSCSPPATWRTRQDRIYLPVL
jgi:hypothetical protein